MVTNDMRKFKSRVHDILNARNENLTYTTCTLIGPLDEFSALQLCGEFARDFYCTVCAFNNRSTTSGCTHRYRDSKCNGSDWLSWPFFP